MPEKQEPALFVFGYGSMINPDSLRKSLPNIEDSWLKPAWLEGFERSWTAIFRIGSHSTSPPKIVPVAFLNITPVPGKRVNGVLIPVRPEDLAVLELRETNYTRLNVTGRVSPTLPGTVYTFSQNASHALYPRAMVAANYLRVVNDGLARLGPEFEEAFRHSTIPCPYPVMEGDYHFLEDTQNMAAGRSKA